MSSTRVNVGRGGGKSAPTPPQRASFVLGSRPPSLRAPRIKPISGQTQYGKDSDVANPAGASFGDTGQTDMS